jgi:hypothetical protein
MRSLMKICLLFFFAFASLQVFAQEQVTDTIIDSDGIVAPAEETSDDESTEEPQTRKYERRYMDERSLQSLRSKPAFQYPDLENDTLNVKPEPPSQQDTRFEGIDATVFLWLIVAVAVIILALQLAGVNMRQLLSPARVDKGNKGGEISGNIHEIPFDKAISDAVNAGNYSLATRLMYLQGLKLLSDKKLIAWHENKTNWQYVYELNNIALRSSFRTVTSIFEYVHYGNMKVEKDKFDHIKEAFRNFKMHVD